MALNSALCIALNRLIAIRATTTEKVSSCYFAECLSNTVQNFKFFFYVSLFFSTLLPVTKIFDLFTFGPLVLEEYNFDYGQLLLPITVFSNNVCFELWRNVFYSDCSDTLNNLQCSICNSMLCDFTTKFPRCSISHSRAQKYRTLAEANNYNICKFKWI